MHHCFNCEVLERLGRIEGKIDALRRAGGGPSADDKAIQKETDILKASETALAAGIQSAESGQAAAADAAKPPA